MSKKSSTTNTTLITIIIPCYNVENKIQKCLSSLKEIQFPEEDYEIIFIDDCSTDNTVSIIRTEIKKQKNWSLLILDKNSGSPSKPRNRGISLAKGEYVFFLDSDDEIIKDALQQQYTTAKKENACIVRGSLIIDINGNQTLTNQIEDFNYNANNQDKIKQIISTQSTTTPSLVKRELLINNAIIWKENIRLGEDTLFLIDVLTAAKNISYIDKPLFIYHKTAQKEASSTQTYGERELRNHLYVWSKAEEKLSKFGFSYFAIRGQVALQTALDGIVYFYQDNIETDLFKEFSAFINTHWETIEKFALRSRFKKALQLLRLNKYNNFFQVLKLKNLVSADDLYDYLKGSIPNDHCKQMNSFQLVRTHIKKQKNKSTIPKRILDFGCGTNHSSDFFNVVLPNTKWFGIENSFLEDSQKNNTKTSNNKRVYDGSALPFKNSYFDLIYSNQVLEHIPDPEQALQEIARILTHEGYFIGQTSQLEPCHSFSYWNFPIYGFKRMIENAGMKLLELRPSIDCFALMERSYTMDYDKYNKYFRVESPLNIDIEQIAQEKKQSNFAINYRKLMYCGQFCFKCALK